MPAGATAVAQWQLVTAHGSRARSASFDYPAQGFDFVADLFGEIGTAASDIANPLASFPYSILCFVRPVFNGLSGVFIATLQITAQLLPGLGRQ